MSRPCMTASARRANEPTDVCFLPTAASIEAHSPGGTPTRQGAATWLFRKAHAAARMVCTSAVANASPRRLALRCRSWWPTLPKAQSPSPLMRSFLPPTTRSCASSSGSSSRISRNKSWSSNSLGTGPHAVSVFAAWDNPVDNCPQSSSFRLSSSGKCTTHRGTSAPPLRRPRGRSPLSGFCPKRTLSTMPSKRRRRPEPEGQGNGQSTRSLT